MQPVFCISASLSQSYSTRFDAFVTILGSHDRLRFSLVPLPPLRPLHYRVSSRHTSYHAGLLFLVTKMETAWTAQAPLSCSGESVSTHLSRKVLPGSTFGARHTASAKQTPAVRPPMLTNINTFLSSSIYQRAARMSSCFAIFSFLFFGAISLPELI